MAIGAMGSYTSSYAGLARQLSGSSANRQRALSTINTANRNSNQQMLRTMMETAVNPWGTGTSNTSNRYSSIFNRSNPLNNYFYNRSNPFGTYSSVLGDTLTGMSQQAALDKLYSSISQKTVSAMSRAAGTSFNPSSISSTAKAFTASNMYSPTAANRLLSNFGSTLKTLGGGTATQMAQRQVNSLQATAQERSNMMQKTASFIQDYTKQMGAFKSAASNITSSSLTSMLGKPSATGFAADNLTKAGNALQNFADQYNQTRTLLTNNLERGTGVTLQLNTMPSDNTTSNTTAATDATTSTTTAASAASTTTTTPATAAAATTTTTPATTATTTTPTATSATTSTQPSKVNTLARLGISYDKTGAMQFDRKTFETTMQSAATADAKTNSTNNVTTNLNAVNSLANTAQRSANMGLMRNQSTLINNDMQKLENSRMQSVVDAITTGYTNNGFAALLGAGAYYGRA